MTGSRSHWPSHGVFALPQYVRPSRAGASHAPAHMGRENRPPTRLVDGDNGSGTCVVSRAARDPRSTRPRCRCRLGGVRRSNHAGTAGLYAPCRLRHGMIGLYGAVANANHMAVWGGAELLLGTTRSGSRCPPATGRWCSTWRPPSILWHRQTIRARRPRHAGGLAG